MSADTVLFDHVAFGVARIADATPFLVGELGGEPMAGGPSPEFRAFQWRFRGGGVIEVLEPNGPPGGFMHRFLEARGAGIHHVTFKVPSLDAACERARSAGYAIVGYDVSSPSWKEAFLHPKQAQGIVVQLAESDPDAGGDWSPDAPPPSPARAARTADVVGLRMRAQSRELALRQWSQVAGGSVADTADLLVFTWPGSHLRLAVEIDPSTPAGPIGVELADVDPELVPKGAHAVLGGGFLLLERAAS